MSDTLFTLSGKIGDNLARLPIAYKFAKQHSIKVDLLIDNASTPIKKLLEDEEWVENVIVSNKSISYGYGGQPYNMHMTKEDELSYKKVFHLGYRIVPITEHFTIQSLRGSECPLDESDILDQRPITINHKKIKNILVHIDAAKDSMRREAKALLLSVWDQIDFDNYYFVGRDLSSNFYDDFSVKPIIKINSEEGFHELKKYMQDSVVFCIDSSIRWLAYCCGNKCVVVRHAGEVSFNGKPSPNEIVVEKNDKDLVIEKLRGFYEKD